MSDPGQNRALRPLLARLETETERLEDTSAVMRLQRAYGYYLDAGLWDQAADLFAADGSIEIGLDGLYVGKERVRQYLNALGRGSVGVVEGRIHECLQLQPVVHMAADGRSARGRWRAFIIAGQLGESAFWGEGPYENEYVKENGVWKIGKLHWYQTFLVPYAGGWAGNTDANGGLYASERLAPDAPPSERYATWPGTYTPPFHYASPVGADGPPAAVISSEDPKVAEIASSAAALATNLARLRDLRQIENLIGAYGYYLDKQVWDSLAELFAEDATMEISQRGIYVGRASIRKALALFGPQGIEGGHVHNHLQLQPLIHVAADGMRAWARSRAFSQLGTYAGNSIWHGGVYENEFVKEHGVWKFKTDHVYTTYFADYERGWMNGPRAAAKVSDKIPPDRPPSEIYEAFPGVYLPPFHYRHPVTGAALSQLREPPRPRAPAAADAAEARIARLARRVQRLEDECAIEILQRAYGYFVDKGLWQEAADLFAEDGTLEIGGRGVFVGRTRVLAYLKWLEPNGLTPGKLFEHMQLQPVITLGANGRSAQGRWHFFAQVGAYQKFALWGLGTYENEYVKENGVWKLKRLHAYFRMYTPYADGWGKTASPITQPEKDLPPDRPPSVQPRHYPSPYVPPFHYKNPVTGR